MLEPYARGAGAGLTALTPDELNTLVAALDAHGVQVAIDAAGDRGVRMALDAFEAAAQRATSPTPRRDRIERAEIVDPDDLPRFKGLGTIAALQPLHIDGSRISDWAKSVGRIARSSAGRHGRSQPQARISPSARTGLTCRFIARRPAGGCPPDRSGCRRRGHCVCRRNASASRRSTHGPPARPGRHSTIIGRE